MTIGELKATQPRTLLRFGVALAALAASLGLPAAAEAGVPTHLMLPTLDLVGAAPDPGPTHPAQPFNHACGTAVDSHGDVYVSSAGNGEVDVFNPAHEFLVAVPDAHEPCGLAVNGKGDLFVSEQAEGKVVRYRPSAYPFVGTPTYGAAEAIDSSGQARGISVDHFDGRLYVAEGTRVAAYNADGSLGINEIQDIACECSGGSFKLIFEGEETEPIPWNAPYTEVGEKLDELTALEGNVSVTEGADYGENVTAAIEFVGALADTNVEQLQANTAGLTGGLVIFPIESRTEPPHLKETHIDGFSGYVGEGSLTEATGVAAYSYKVSALATDRRLFVADGAGPASDRVDIFGGEDIRTLRLRREILGPRGGEPFGFESEDSYLTVDPGNRNAEDKCMPVAEQACTAGHFLVHDAAHDAVDEFDASGEFLDQLPIPGLSEAQPTAMAVDRSGGANDGTIYVTSGAGAGAKLLALSPLAAPSRASRPELSQVLQTAAAVATDSHGDVYVVAGSQIRVFSPHGEEIGVGPAGHGIEDPNGPDDIAVDSTGRVYVADYGRGFDGEAKATYYTPSTYPPVDGAVYARREPPISTLALSSADGVWLAVNPANDHLFVENGNEIQEFDSAAPGHESKLLDPCFACGLPLRNPGSISVDGATGDVFVATIGGAPMVSVLNPQGDEILSRITGAGSPRGVFGDSPHIAVDQSNGHLVEFQPGEAAREYDAAGGFVAEFGSSTARPSKAYRVAIDNACALHEPPLAGAACGAFDPADGTVYVAYDDPAPETFDVTAFGPLAYGEPPLTVTGIAGGFGSGGVTLNGTVNPNGFDLTECVFQYISDAAYGKNLEEAKPPFAGAEEEECAGGASAVGKGQKPVAVHAEIATLAEPQGRYRFRLLAANKYGLGEGGARLFGPPVIGAEGAFPVGYDEATLHASLDPSGLPTTYHFDYVDQAGFEKQGGFDGAGTRHTPSIAISPDAPPGEVKAELTGLAEGTAYRFRFVAENGDEKVVGVGGPFDTLQRRVESCPNVEYRTGLSANLPDCRAYELVTPAQTNGLSPGATGLLTVGSGEAGFNDWLVTPRGSEGGERLSYFTTGTLPGFDGNGLLDAYRAQRGEGVHPSGGWVNALFSPTYQQASPDFSHSAASQGVASDELYSFWLVDPAEALAESLAPGSYLRTPAGFESLGKGSQGIDPDAIAKYVSPGGAHVVFSSSAELEEAAPPPGVRTVYDRAAGSGTAQVVSLPPSGASPATKAEFEGNDAIYLGASEDGAAIAFSVNGVLYARSDGQTVEVAAAPNTFAGISEDGERIFYAAARFQDPVSPRPAALFACDVAAAPCAGPGARQPAPIGHEGSKGTFVTVSPDGSDALFTSEEVLTEGEENENGEEAEPEADNLYAWDVGSESVRFVALLDPEDLELGSFTGGTNMSLGLWTSSIVPGPNLGRAESPTRATPDGSAFSFQSHAQLTAYDNERVGEIYRYDPGAPTGQRLLCVSCNPTGAPPSGPALLEDTRFGSGVDRTTMIPNITDDGQRAFFESPDRLVPEDANEAVDVYEWEAEGSGGCRRPRGCISLISSGQGEAASHLFGMSASGHDVFFRTEEQLLGADLPGSVSIYDAREGGGIPERATEAPCQGDACQGIGSEPPALPAPATSGGGSEERRSRRCGKGRHRAKGRCVKRHHRKRHHRKRHHQRHRTHRSGRAGR
jgi:sugar lactone lactonase YvrE